MDGEERMRPLREVIAAGAGAQAAVLSIHQGKVVIHFQQLCEWMALDPETARKLSEDMARFAYEAHYGRAPTQAEAQSFLAQGIRKKLTKILRQKMVNRTVMLLRNFNETKPALGYQAEQIVDHVLKEVA